ncbi:NAD(P)-binding protein [Trametopsis cervina]|nr:NAD(P)-binding protein [Trametopsis cervina]
MASFIGLLKRLYTVGHPPKAEKTANPLRFGILGAAAIAPEALIRPVISHPDAVVYAVAARDLTRAQAFAKTHGIEKAYGGANAYQDLLDDPSVDVVYNPLPNALHYEWTMKALAAKKHVLLEKPTADTVAETREMFEFARKQGVVLMEAFHYRFHPVNVRAKAILDSGELGAIKSIEARARLAKGMVPPTDIRFNHALGGGAMMDFGCYCINTLRYYTGSDPLSIVSVTPDVFVPPTSSSSSPPAPSQIDAGMDATLSYPSNILGSFVTHLAAPPRFGFLPIVPEIRLKVVCENGELEIFNYVMATLYHSVTVSVKSGKEGKGRRSRVEKVYRPTDGGKGEEWWTTYRYQLEAFIDKVRGREPERWVSEEESIATMEWVEKVYEQSGLGVRPPSGFKLAVAEA